MSLLSLVQHENGVVVRSRRTLSLANFFALLLLLLGSAFLGLLSHQSRRAPSGPPRPSRAFFITTEARHASNWTAYTMDQLMRRRGILNFDHLDVVTTAYHGEFGPPFEEKTGVRPELSMAHLRVWEQIVAEGLDSAWVFEDDVVFHDDFDTLFPLYWAGVPRTYEMVFVGQSPMGHSLPPACQVSAADVARDAERDIKLRLHPNKMLQVRDPVYCTHAMAVSRTGARRAARAMRGNMFLMAISKQPPHYYEVNVDLVLEIVHRYHLTPADQRNWVAFDPTVAHPAKWAGLEWCRMAPMQEWPANCTCETCMVGVQPWVGMQVPLFGTGLVFHNWCKNRPADLERWRDGMRAAVAAGGVNPDPIGGKQWARTPFKYWAGAR